MSLETLALVVALLVAAIGATWQVAHKVSERRQVKPVVATVQCLAPEHVEKHEASARDLARQIHDHLREESQIRREQHRDVQAVLAQQTAILQKLSAILERPHP